MREEQLKSLKFWDGIHRSYKREEIKVDNWLEEFLPIIQASQGPILDIGCGSGNDTLYFIAHGKKVIACDQSPNAIENIKKNFPEIWEARCFNFLDGFDFQDGVFEVICADLCLHYFRMEDTRYILGELKRILVPGGHIFVRVNTINDVLHGAGQGEEIEKHLFKMEDGTIKRFFDDKDIESVFSDFEIVFCKEQKMHRYQREKVVYTVCLRKIE